MVDHGVSSDSTPDLQRADYIQRDQLRVPSLRRLGVHYSRQQLLV
jgi:hypothetical protein